MISGSNTTVAFRSPAKRGSRAETGRLRVEPKALRKAIESTPKSPLVARARKTSAETGEEFARKSYGVYCTFLGWETPKDSKALVEGTGQRTPVGWGCL